MHNKEKFFQLLSSGVILFDGGIGTELYNRGIFINRCFEELNLTNPNLVAQVHKDYVESGSDIIETNTFGANRFKLRKFQLFEKIYDINYQGTLIARKEAGKDILVAGSIGPLTIQIEPLGPISREEARDLFKEQIIPLYDGGVDLFILETFVNPEELKEAVNAVRQFCDLPVIAQLTIKEDTTTLTGAKPEIIINADIVARPIKAFFIKNTALFLTGTFILIDSISLPLI